MKKFALVALTIAIAIILAACDNAAMSDQNSNITNVDGLNVILPVGLSESDINISEEEILSRIESAIHSSGARMTMSDETSLTDIELSVLIENAISISQVPIDGTVPTEIPYQEIRQSFPDLTDREIENNIELIQNIYTAQVTALSLSQVENFLSRNTVTSSRHVYDYDLAPGEQTVTGWEIAACLKHPFSALTLNKTRNEAFSLTAQVFGGNGRQTNVVADAFRHAALNILLSRNGVGFRSLKIMWAVDFATAHEKGANYHPGPSDMDLHNNLVGRNIYRAVTSPKKIKFLWSWIEVGVNGEPSNNRIIELLNPFVENAVYVEYQEDSDHDVYLGILDQVDVNTLVYISE